MEMKLAPLSLAAALATRVLPQPGGPYSSTPVGADRPSAAKRSGCLMGCVTEKASSSLTCAARCRSFSSGEIVYHAHCLLQAH